jgi:sugar lactone lactonase YvrE
LDIVRNWLAEIIFYAAPARLLGRGCTPDGGPRTCGSVDPDRARVGREELVGVLGLSCRELKIMLNAFSEFAKGCAACSLSFISSPMHSHRFTSVVMACCSLGFIALVRLGAEDYAITAYAGAANVTTGADGSPGSFNNPYGVAIDAAKNIYVADTLNNTIRKISPSRVVSTLAGTAVQFGAANDGLGAAARFNFPVGIALDTSGNIYVADVKSFTIRKVTPAGLVTTLAGAPFSVGATDGAGSAARFFLPFGVAVDAAGRIYVADSGNHLIRKITPEGVVSTLAGGAAQSGFIDGAGSAARFSTPMGIAVDAGGNLFVADSGNQVIRRITPAGLVSTVAGNAGVSGSNDGAALGSKFNQPRGLAVDTTGNVYVADYGNNVIRLVTAAGLVSTLAGSAGIAGEANSVGAAARFYEPVGIALDGTTFYVADSSNNQIRRGQPASTAALPVISLQPFDQAVSVGQAVTFSVTVAGSNLTYQWLRNGVAMTGATTATYAITSAQLSDVSAFSCRISSAGGAVDSTTATLSVAPLGTGPVVIAARPLSQNVVAGQSATFSINATGTALTYQWSKNGGTLGAATNSVYTLMAVQPGDAATYSVRVSSGSVSETATAKLTVGGVAGAGVAITAPPMNQSVVAGQSVTFSVSASGAASLSYQWLKNQSPIAGATNANYTIASAQSGDAALYAVRVSGGGQNIVSADASLTVVPVVPVLPSGPTARLSNLSVRTAMAPGQILTVGMVVDGGGARNILVRAAGPALAGFGIPTAMVDPRLEFFKGSTMIFANDDWPANLVETFGSVGAFAFQAGSKDAAFVQSVDGLRTIQAQGTGAGVVLVEAYDVGAGNSPRMVNVSARNRVGTGENILIAGFVVDGTGTKQLLIRAVGPALGLFSVPGFLVDPKLELYLEKTKLAENDNWAGALAATFQLVGAFALTPGSRDAALLTTLAPGSYTVQVSGADGGTGEALVEIYEVP